MSGGRSCIALVTILELGCVDHHYAHSLRGRVVDPTGTPVSMARVCPVATAGMPEDFETYVKVHHLEDRICVQSDADGRFELSHSGLGPEPKVFARWNLLAIHPDWTAGHASVTAIWLDSYGYSADHVEIVVGSDVVTVPFETWVCAMARHVRELHGLEGVSCPKGRR